jgi:SAM-dependent methyltransferase
VTIDFDVPSDWYESFFSPSVNRFWESVTSQEATEAEVDFLIRHARLTAPSRVADLACGAGRHSLSLARRGHCVTGIDISSDAIARATQEAGEAGLNAKFCLGDLRSAVLPGEQDAMIWLGGSLAYFEPAALPSMIARLTGTLRSGGHLLIETFCCAETLFPFEAEREIPLDGGSYRSTLSYDPLRSLLKTRAELRLGEECHELLYAHHVVTSGELVRHLAAAGLRTLGLYGGTEGEAFRPGDRRLLLLARRE